MYLRNLILVCNYAHHYWMSLQSFKKILFYLSMYLVHLFSTIFNDNIVIINYINYIIWYNLIYNNSMISL